MTVDFRRWFALTSSIILLLLTTSCLLPPADQGPQVIPADELQIVSGLRHGKDYAASGRFDLAEREYRQVLALSPNLPTALNDLGYVLLSLNRDREAIEYFQQLLLQTPNNLTVRENIARAYYRTGDFDAANQELENLAESYLLLSPPGLPVTSASASGLGDAYQNLSMLRYALGFDDEAVCYASRAMEYSHTPEHIGRLTRMLLSLDRLADAEQVLTKSIAENPLPALLGDYAMTLFSLKKNGGARDAASRVLSSSQSESAERRIARLVRVMLDIEEHNDADESLIRADLEDDENVLCEKDFLLRQSYWPTEFVDRTTEFLKSLCPDETDEH